jgi:hypothetical protein
MEVSKTQQLKGLEDENRRPKQLVADLSLDKEALRANVKKNLGFAGLRKDVAFRDGAVIDDRASGLQARRDGSQHLPL